ncbi:MAG: gliding motility protein GldL [Bacteroidales bacterium]|nr:gliding motility protein GldL [Bacteroidales bacterium]
MNLSNIVKSRGYKNFMSKLYGIGAAIVIIGALFKITHIKFADVFLFVGLVTEAVIFFFSAFEPPHVEPDWSLVYPELAGMYHTEEDMTELGLAPGAKGLTHELDKMLSNAKIEPELINSLGAGLLNLNETVQGISSMSTAAVANDEFVNNVKGASRTAAELTDSYRKTANALNLEAQISGEHSTLLQSVGSSASNLSTAYSQAADAMRTEVMSRERLNEMVMSAAVSASDLNQKYAQSAEMLTKAAAAIDISYEDGGAYREQINKITKSLSSLNTIYELQLRTTEEQLNVSTQASGTYIEMLGSLKQSVVVGDKYQETLNELNQAFERQLIGTSAQADKSIALQQTFDDFLMQMRVSIDQTNKYQQQADMLTKNLAALNNVYGNMLTAMNFKI